MLDHRSGEVGKNREGVLKAEPVMNMEASRNTHLEALIDRMDAGEVDFVHAGYTITTLQQDQHPKVPQGTCAQYFSVKRKPHQIEQANYRIEM